MADTPGQDNPGDLWKAADKVTGLVGKNWWARQDSSQQMAWTGLAAAGAVAVLGVPLLSIIQGAGSIPASDHLAAAFYLIVITLPVTAAAGVFVLLAGKTSGYALTLGCAAAAVAGVGVMVGAVNTLGGKIAGFYCYNDGTVFEEQCRQFNEAGFYATAHAGSPAQNLSVVGSAFVYTVDARGSVIAICGIVAGLCAGYLVRRSSESM